MLTGRRILLIVTGGVAAYKAPVLIRRLRDKGAAVTPVLTEGGARFIPPLTLAAVAGEPVRQALFDAEAESAMSHIDLARAADAVVVAPASADMLARMAHGLADDLATTLLLATDAPVLVAPAMNAGMWAHSAMQANMATLEARGVHRAGPAEGDLACGETGPGRMEAPETILSAVEGLFAAGPLAGRTALVTSGPTQEPVDGVRYLGNRSSGRQGHAIAAALARLGATVHLVRGPVAIPDPPGVRVTPVTTADEMHAACLGGLPVDVAVCAAAVADWRVADADDGKLKKGAGRAPPALRLEETPDVLSALAAAGPHRPRLVVGFAAETESVVDNAVAKRARKGADWLLANDVSAGTETFGGAANTVHLVTADGTEAWPRDAKTAVADTLAHRIASALEAP